MNTLSRISYLIVAILSITATTCKGPQEVDVIKISGVVSDLLGGHYPGVEVILTIPEGEMTTSTNSSGEYSFRLLDGGVSKITIVSPLNMVIEGDQEQTFDLKRGDDRIANFQLSPLPPPHTLVLGINDILEEIRNKDGREPIADSELIFARNAFDPPIGLLTPIRNPDSIQLTLGDWKQARGTLSVSCDGNKSTALLDFQGMIPGGTYTIWCNFLNKPKQPGESINFNLDVEKILPLGSGSSNIVIADSQGKILSSITHSSCLLTESKGLAVVVDYHLNGKTFGAAHIPDEEDANQLLFYFQ